MRDMTRKEWYQSVGDLRMVLHGHTSGAGKFRRVNGSGYLVYIYNLKSDNVIATIRQRLVRVRPNSLYASVIREWAKNNGNIVVDSNTLSSIPEARRELARHTPESRPTFNRPASAVTTTAYVDLAQLATTYTNFSNNFTTIT